MVNENGKERKNNEGFEEALENFDMLCACVCVRDGTWLSVLWRGEIRIVEVAEL